MNFRSIRFTILSGALVAMLVVMLAATLSSSMILFNQTEQAASDYAKATSMQIARQLEIKLNEDMSVARAMAELLSTIPATDHQFQLSRAQVAQMFGVVIREHQNFDGLYTNWEPDAFDGQDAQYAGTLNNDETGRLNVYWTRREDVIELDPAPVFDLDDPVDGDYYIVPSRTFRDTLLEPYYLDEAGTTLMTSLVSPILYNDKFYGIVGIDLPVTYFTDLVDSFELYEGRAEILVISYSGTLVAVSHRPDLEGKTLADYRPGWESYLSTIQHGQPETIRTPDSLVIFVPMRVGNSISSWSVNINIPLSAVRAEPQRLVFIQVLVAALAVLVGLALLWVISNQIAKPVVWLSQAIERLSTGDTSSAGSQSLGRLLSRRDELGTAGHALMVLTGYLQHLAEAANAIAHGRINVEIEARSEQDSLGKAHQTMVASLGEMVTDIQSNAGRLQDASAQLSGSVERSGDELTHILETIQTTTGEIARQTDATRSTAASITEMDLAISGVAHGAQDQAKAIARVSDQASVISQAIQQVSGIAARNSQEAAQTASLAQGGAAAVQRSIQGMNIIQQKVSATSLKVTEMGSRSEEIGVIVDTIEDIARQTNLLALNAAIEAARTGGQAQRLKEAILDWHMVVQAELMCELLRNKPKAALTDEYWVDLARRTNIDSIYITDGDGVVEYTNDLLGKGWRFPDDPKAQAFPFRALLKQSGGVVTQPVTNRSLDNALVKYIGVSRKDQPGIVQVGFNADSLKKVDLNIGGFAVVAQEVRLLAERSQASSKEIAKLTEAIRVSARESVKAMQEGVGAVAEGMHQAESTQQALDDILKAVGKVAEQTGAAAQAAAQMDAASRELDDAVSSVSAVVEENTAATEEMAAGFNELLVSVDSIASGADRNRSAMEALSASSASISERLTEMSSLAQGLEGVVGMLKDLAGRFQQE